MNQREWDREHGLPWTPCPTCGGTGKIALVLSPGVARCPVCVGPCWPSQNPSEKDRV